MRTRVGIKHSELSEPNQANERAAGAPPAGDTVLLAMPGSATQAGGTSSAVTAEPSSAHSPEVQPSKLLRKTSSNSSGENENPVQSTVRNPFVLDDEDGEDESG